MPTEVGKPGKIRRGKLPFTISVGSALRTVFGKTKMVRSADPTNSIYPHFMESPTVQLQIKESTTPNPPRYRWLRRSLGIFAILLALLVGLWFCWAHVAANRLRAAIDEVHARGEPIEMEDFTFPAIPDKENPAVYYARAHASAVQPTQIDQQWIGWNQYWSPTAVASLGALIDKENVSLGLIRQPRGYPRSVWPVVYRRPAIMILLPQLNWLRQLANTMAAATFVAHQRDQDDLAVETLRDMHHFADSVQQYGPFLVACLVASGIDDLCSRAAIDLARDMRISDGSVSSTTQPIGASRRQVMDLIADLSDESEMNHAFSRATWGERMMAIDPGSRGLLGIPIPVTKVLGPAFDLDAAQMVRYDTQIAVAVSQPNYPAAKAAMPAPLKVIKNSKFIAAAPHLFASLLAPSYQNIVRERYRKLTDRRSAVIALALRLYRFDHNGHWPDSLDALIPQYLPAIPIDPFSPTAVSFRYKPPAAGAVPIIYSVGENGVDDGGRNSSGIPSTPGWWTGPDLVYDLIVPPATTQPSDSSQAGENNANK
jgi:type II secretory pathway pseudopilin PulG